MLLKLDNLYIDDKPVESCNAEFSVNTTKLHVAVNEFNRHVNRYYRGILDKLIMNVIESERKKAKQTHRQFVNKKCGGW